MIPLYKLEKLPRTQKLRKIVKVFSMAENRLVMAREKTASIFTQDEIIFFTEAVVLLSKDSHFPIHAKKIFIEATDVFILMRTADDAAKQNLATNLRRALNNVKHILLTETGKDQADWDFTNADGGLDRQKRTIFEGTHIYLEDIRSPFNVGAMFRTAESFGVEKIILSPFCADPRHRRSLRTAMGCIDIINWERRDLFAAEDSTQETLNIFALETGGMPLAEFKFPKRGLLIAGSEELGVSPRALAAADASLGRVSIPCYGTKASLNVSVAFGIALQAWASAIAY